MSASKWVLASRPTSPRISEHLAIEPADVASPAAGEFLIQPLVLRAAPPMFKVMVSGSADGRPTPIGSTIAGAGVGRVVESRHQGFPVGSLVTGSMPWQELVTSDGRTVAPVQLLTPLPDVASTAYLHVLGGPGLSAYFGLTEIGRPKVGDTIVVSTAAGAVGAVVCQLARRAGCRVVGITSTPAKCEWLHSELRVDAAIAYRTEDVESRLRELCPSGIDIYFDNVGGETLDMVLGQITDGARIVLCGASSQYDRKDDWVGPRHYFNLVYRQAAMLGFYVFNYTSQFPAARARLAALLSAGELRYAEDVVDGFVNAAAAFDRVLASENLGVQLVRFSAD